MSIRSLLIAACLAAPSVASAQTFYPNTSPNLLGQYYGGGFGSPNYVNPSIPNGFVPNTSYGYAAPGVSYGAQPQPGFVQPNTGVDDVMRQGGVRQDTSRTAPPNLQMPNGASPTVQDAPRDPKGERIEGVARVADGNTLVIGGDVVVLNGADAPELDQTCSDRGGLAWKCGLRSMDRLVQLVHGKRVLCVGVAMAGKAVVANCRHGGIDIAQTMVREGWAMSPSAVAPLYVSEERAAQLAGSGVWSGSAKRPWEVRAGK